jgi:hypothetical protein
VYGKDVSRLAAEQRELHERNHPFLVPEANAVERIGI